MEPIKLGDRVKFTNKTDPSDRYNWQLGDEGVVLEVSGLFVAAQKDWPDGPIEYFMEWNLEALPSPEPACEPSLSPEPSHPQTSQPPELLSADPRDRLAQFLTAWGDDFEISPEKALEVLERVPPEKELLFLADLVAVRS